MYEEACEEDAADGRRAPAWPLTFAAVMLLLTCFLVLLLSFSEVDVARYRTTAAAVGAAFHSRPSDALVTGGAVAIRDMAPAGAAVPIGQALPDAAAQAAAAAEVLATRQHLEQLLRQTRDDASALAAALGAQIAQGEVEIETRGRRITLRLREEGCFDPGAAEPAAGCRTLLRQVRDLLATRAGRISIEGHTDDAPPASAAVRSNWELAARRAAAVAGELLADGVLAAPRVTVVAHAGTRPLVANDSAENRRRNCRVELVVSQPVDADTRDRIEALQQRDPAYYREHRLDELLRAGEAESP